MKVKQEKMREQSKVNSGKFKRDNTIEKYDYICEYYRPFSYYATGVMLNMV
jgi:hypothetical protein